MWLLCPECVPAVKDCGTMSFQARGVSWNLEINKPPLQNWLDRVHEKVQRSSVSLVKWLQRLPSSVFYDFVWAPSDSPFSFHDLDIAMVILFSTNEPKIQRCLQTPREIVFVENGGLEKWSRGWCNHTFPEETVLRLFFDFWPCTETHLWLLAPKFAIINANRANVLDRDQSKIQKPKQAMKQQEIGNTGWQAYSQATELSCRRHFSSLISEFQISGSVFQKVAGYRRCFGIYRRG